VIVPSSPREISLSPPQLEEQETELLLAVASTLIADNIGTARLMNKY